MSDDYYNYDRNVDGYCPACEGHGTNVHECQTLLSVVVRKADLRHLLEMYFSEDGRVDFEILDRLWKAVD